MTTLPIGIEREGWVRRGQWLSGTTLGYNSVEGLVAIGVGLLAGSIALVGFGFDSAIELAASAAALWRLNADVNPA
jgi:divalent metal cation (Fe/Co/Zn/Cd) transporter